jgi:hypothetical protein
MRKALIACTTLLAISCTRQQKSGSSIAIQIPTINELKNAKVGALSGSIDPALLCFGVNVVGPGISTNAPSSCDIQRGATAGMVPPGGVLSVDVAKGEERVVELYGYLRSSSADSCPSAFPVKQSALWNSTYAVGKTSHISVQEAEQVVDVTLVLPSSASETVAANAGWSTANCANSGGAANSKFAFHAMDDRKLSNGTYILSGQMHFHSGLSEDNTNGTYHIKGVFRQNVDGGGL